MNDQHSSFARLAARFQSDAYQLTDKIGQGGFGEVYKAKQLNTGQNVAIKFLTLNPDLDDEKKNHYIERFKRETLLGSRLQHPNIVRLLDKGCCDDDLLYAVFEYVDGDTLKKTLSDSGALPPTEAAEIMAQVLDALAHAHQQGVIHRDIKPANIMLIKSGTKTHAKVLDFGIGTLVNEARQLDYKSITMTQETLGTPSYSAPEQLRGEPPTPKTDIYVWGLVFVECLTAQAVISGSSLASVFHKQLSQSNVPLPAAIVSHPVGALLRRALQKKVHERTITVSELYNELMRINFSNLVGTLGKKPATHTGNITDRTQAAPSDDDQTRVNAVQNPTGEFDRCQKTYMQLTERKQITALSICLDLQPVTNEVIDYEVAETLHRDQKSHCVDIAIRYGAFHVGTLGDTLLFYFGYPVASDDDIRLCARAALDIISTLNQRNSQLRHTQGVISQAHIGIHTGMATCYPDATPLGNTPNVAMALTRFAAANQILCSDASRKMLENHIEFKPEQARITGLDIKETPTYALIGERQIEAFGFLRGTGRAHDFIGRQAELDTLVSLLAAQQHTAQPLMPCLGHVYGEAGIGKSRLIFELRSAAKDFVHYVVQCLPEHQNNALYPVLNLLKYKYSLATLTAEQSVRRLQQYIGRLNLSDQASTTAILCAWLNLPLTTDIAPGVMSPEAQKQRLFMVLTRLLAMNAAPEQAGGQKRTLFIFEDLHWADPTTIEFVRHLAQDPTQIQAQQVLITTSRQVLPESWSAVGFSCVNVLRLERDKTIEFIINLFDQQSVNDNILNALISRTDGIPLFIEELVNMLKQKKLVHHLNGRVDFINPDDLGEVPGSLRDSLQHKLDTLVYAKETAQLAATIGREFDYDLLVAASHQSESQVQTDLNELIETGLVYQQRKVGGNRYIFKHALIKDAAYDSIPGKTQQKIHHDLAHQLQSRFAARAQLMPHLLGHHWSRAQQPVKAGEWFVLAGKKAATTFANNESITHYHKAVEQLLRITGDAPSPAGALRHNKLAEAYKGIGEGEIANGQQQQAREAFAQALTHLDNSPLEQAGIHHKIGKSWETHHYHQQALEEYQKAEDHLTLATDAKSSAQWLTEWLNIHSARLYVHYWLGDVAAMKQLIKVVEPLVRQRGTVIQQVQFLDDLLHLRLRELRFNLTSEDIMIAKDACTAADETTDEAIKAWSNFMLGFALYFNAQYQPSHQAMHHALERARTLNDITLQSRCLTYLSVSQRHLGNIEATGQYAKQSLQVSEEAGMYDYVAAAKANLAWVALRRDNKVLARQLVGESLQTWDRLASHYPYPFQWLGLLLQLELNLQPPPGSVPSTAVAGLSHTTAVEIMQLIHALLDDKQQRLPESINQPFAQAVTQYNLGNGYSGEVHRLVNQALDASHSLSYL